MKGKQLISLASAAILGLSVIPMSVSAADNVDANGRDLRYDMNMDGVVNSLDGCVIAYYYALNQSGRDYHTNETAIAIGMTDEVVANIELNGNLHDDEEGAIDLRDAVVIQSYLEDTGYLFGDINRDGKLDSVDASKILACYAKMQTTSDYYLSEEYVDLLPYADADFNCLIDANDASRVLYVYAQNQSN